jgi:hypothetical protein
MNVRPVRPLLPVTLACLLANAALAQPPQHPGAAPPVHRPSVAIESYASGEEEYVFVYLGASRDPDLRVVPGGIELVVDDPWIFRLAHYRGLRRVRDVQLREEAGKSVALFHLACDCLAKTSHKPGTFTLEIEAKPAAAATPVAPSGLSPTAAAPAGRSNRELERLRDALTTKLAQLNAPPSSPATPDMPATPVAPLRPAVCPAGIDTTGWKGTRSFSDELAVLRARAAAAHEAAPDMAALAQFYLGYGLAAEALSVLQQTQPAPSGDAQKARFATLADIAHLLRREPIAADASLLAAPAGCTRSYLPLWQALAAATGHDGNTVTRLAKPAQDLLRMVPEPLLQRFAYAIAEAAPNDVAVQRAMASAVRNTNEGSPENVAERFLIQARIAAAEHDAADQVAFLERAAADYGTVAGATARVELAGLRSKEDGDLGTAAEVVLADSARVYRADELGQTAAAYLAERRLRLGDYATALAVADASAGPVATRRTDSRGAAMAARILRQLLVRPASADLPPPEERLVLYWQYEGYATPGPQGDDIRLAAARMMLAEDMPAAALALLNSVGATAEVLLLRATAEARGGDPAAALVMLQALPTDDAAHRATADALVRLGRPDDAAQQLDGLAGIADRMRRTELLAVAADWPAVVRACDELLRDPTLDGAMRRAVADRYSLALALSGQSPDHDVKPHAGSLGARVVAALPDIAGATPMNGAPSISRVRDALMRARQIETLLPATDGKQGS